MKSHRSFRRLGLLAGSFASLAIASAVSAAVEATTPTTDAGVVYLFQDTQPAINPIGKPQALNVVVKDMAGNVMASTDEGKTWKKVKLGDIFGPGTIFRTGLRSAVTCSIGGQQAFTLESLSTIRVEEASVSGKKEKTDLLMKYGSASYGIEAAGREYDATIRTPGSTMAIRGTVVRVSDRPGFAPTAESYTGRALFRTARGSTFVGGKGYSIASAVQGTAAETALAHSSIDPSIAAARTASESTVVEQQLSQGGVLGFDNKANIPVVRGGGPLPDSSLPGALPGRLSFALRWTGNADLNFIVDNQSGDQTKIIFGGFHPTEILFPGYGLNTSVSGGIIPYDHRGGPNGGTEIAYWKGSFPTGVYGVGVLHASGATADFKINAFLDGQALPIFTFDEEGNIISVNTLRGTVGKDGSDGAILFVPRSEFFESIATPGDSVTQNAAARAIAAMKKDSSKKATGPVATTPKSLGPKIDKMKAATVGPRSLKTK